MTGYLDVFIGYDERESIAYHVLADSIKRHASIPVNVRPLITENIPAFTRPRDPKQSTDFAFSRFMVPYLSDYKGVSVFMDCDMLMRADIAELMADVPERAAVSVCQHNYTPKTATKFLGAPQTPYPRKNWSSLMVFDNAKCRKLTPYYVNRASGADLHQLKWLRGGTIPGMDIVTTYPPDHSEWVPEREDDHLIGALPLTWNWLVGEYADNPDAKCWHWTIGGPWFPDYAETAHADEWRAARHAMLVQRTLDTIGWVPHAKRESGADA